MKNVTPLKKEVDGVGFSTDQCDRQIDKEGRAGI